MKSFTKLSKLTLALSLALFGGASSISALAMATDLNDDSHEFHEVIVEVNNDENANIRVEINGKVTDLIVPKGSLHDREKLAEALSDVPVEVREKLLTDLNNIHIGDKMIEVHEFDSHENINWVSKDGERIVIIDSDSDSVAADGRVDINQMVKRIKHERKMNPEMVLRLIKEADFSQEELDKIQQAIDEER